MDTTEHSMNTLFAQLGLPSSDDEIADFIHIHRPLLGDEPIEEAEFWSENQAAFLIQALSQDSDWSPLVDELSSLLRTRH